MKTLQAIFSIDAPQGLVQAVLSRIETARTRRARQRILVWIGAEVTALAGCVVALRYALQAFAASAFPQYIALIFSDRFAILGYWRQFLAALSESVPLVGVGLVIAAVIAALFALNNILSIAQRLTHHHTYGYGQI